MPDRTAFPAKFKCRSKPTPVSPIERMLQTKRQQAKVVTLAKVKCLEDAPSEEPKE